MEKDPGFQKAPVVFPFLIEEPKSTHQDGIMTKWSSHRRQTPLVKDALFPPSQAIVHGRERCLKGFHSTNHKQIINKSYSCPNIVDMSNIIFYHDRAVGQEQPRRIINGFFPNKIRSQNRGRTTTQSQVGMYLGRINSASLPGHRARHKPHSPTAFHGPNYNQPTNGSHADVEHLNHRRSQSSWPLRDGSSSPWLQRYKFKKRSTTSYALEKSGEDSCLAGGTEIRPKRSQEYVNLSNAVILDGF